MTIIVQRSSPSFVVAEDASILEALKRIEKNKLGSVVVVDRDGKLIGTISDGDFRRWLMIESSPDLNAPCGQIMNRRPVSLVDGASLSEVGNLMTSGVRLIPFKDDRGRVVSIATQRSRQLEIERRTISNTDATFVIAEIGINHNGDIETAKKLVDAAVHAKADCAKFQLRDIATLYRAEGNSDNGSEDLGAEYTIDLLRASSLDSDQIIKLMDYVKDKGLIPLCTPWDLKSAAVLMDYGVPAFKLASADLTNEPLIQFVAKSRIPTLMSTGMSTESEIRAAVEIFKNEMSPFALLHCQSVYPPAYRDLNLNYLARLADIGNSVIGYSSHERGMHIAVSAVAMGARIIEKHITLDRRSRGIDHVVSLEPDEFALMVNQIRTLEESLGNDLPRELTQGEKLNRISLSKSLVAKKAIKSGHVVSHDDVEVRSPGKGLQPNRLKNLIGVSIARDISQGDFFFETDLEDEASLRRTYKVNRPWGLPVRFHDWESLLRGTNPDFLEFHLSYRDMSINFEKSIKQKLDLSLVVHSPDLFKDDHILDLASADESIRQSSVQELQKVVNLTNKLVKKFSSDVKPIIVASLGGSSMHAPCDVSERPKMYERVKNSLLEVDLGNALILAQTLPPFPWYLGGQRYCNLFVDPFETAYFAETYGVSLCVDISHTKLACNFLGLSFSDAIENLAPYARHFHLVDASGVDREGLQIGDGEVDWSHLIKQIDKLAPGVGFIPEIWQGHVDNGKGFWIAMSRLEDFMSC